MIKTLLFILPSLALAASSGDSDTGAVCCGTVVFILIVIAIKESIERNGGRLKQADQLPENTGNNNLPDLPPRPHVPSGSSFTSLHVVVVPEEKDFGSGIVSCLTVNIRGLVTLPPNMLTAVFSLSLWDETFGSDNVKPVLCSIPELQERGSQAFLWTQQLQMNFPQSLISDWIEIISIPTDMLIFPARGNRILHFHLSIAPFGQLKNPTTTASSIIEYKNSSLGYVDGIALRIKAEELGLKYAAAVSAIDGTIDSEEKTVIRKWMDTRIDSLPENLRAETTRSLSRALMIAERLSASIKPEDIEMLCDDIAEDYPIGSFPKGELYDIVELCMRVAAADGIASPEELKLVDRIASLLRVDMDRFRKMSEKILPVNIHSKKDIASILGLKSDWTVKQRKKHLRDQYREWSARVTHSDAEVREQADEMLRIIAEERAKIDAEH